MDYSDLDNIDGVELLVNTPIEKFTTMRLGGVSSIAICKSVDALKKLIVAIGESPYHLIGWGANQVIENEAASLLIKLDFEVDRTIFREVRASYELPASIALNTLSSHAQKFGLKGWEAFTGIPASLGGAIYMNAGTALGEIGSIVKEVSILQKNGSVRIHKVDIDSFSYRKNHFVADGEIIISACLVHLGQEKWISDKIKTYSEYRKTTQPLRARTCGSVFKNSNTGVRAGATIDACGLKGFGYENLFVSYKHANFIEHESGGTADDFKKLLECLKIDIERYSAHKFELEVKVY